MANYCDFRLKAMGDRKGIDALERVFGNSLKYVADGKEERLARIFEAQMNRDGDETLYVSGCCAWSVYRCMFDGANTYYRSGGKESGLTTLPALCRKYGMAVEVFGSEPGMGYAEYYFVDEEGRVDQAQTELKPWPEDEDEQVEFDPTEGVMFDTEGGEVAFGEFTMG